MIQKQSIKKENEAKDSNNINPNNQLQLKVEDQMKTTKDFITQNVDNGNGTSEMKIENISLNSLIVKYHPRNTLGDIESLQGSIKRDGLQEPLLVYEVGENRYAVIDGVRRLATIQELGWNSAPCLIRKGMDASDAAHLSYVKNTERNSLNPVEIAIHLKAMTSEFGFSLRDLEIKGYGSPASIGNKMKLLELDESVQKQVQSGKLTVAHGLELIKISDGEEQKRMAERVIDKNWTAKTTGTHINRYVAKNKKQDKLSMVHHSPSGITNISTGNRFHITQMPDESVHMIFTAPDNSPGHYAKMKRYILEECARILAPGGVMVLYILDCNEPHNWRSDHSKYEFQPGVNKYLHALRKNNVYLTSRILVPYIPSRAFVDEKADHTSYEIYKNYWPFYILRKNGKRIIPSEEIVKESKLTKEEQETWTLAVWKTVNDKEADPNELMGRFIKMFSYRGDIVFNPFLKPVETVKIARELNRIGIDSDGKLHCKPEIKKDYGIESAGDGSETFETLRQFYKRMIDSGTDDSGPSIEIVPVGSKANVPLTEQVEEGKKASDESPETTAGFCERMVNPESKDSESFIESIPVNTGKTFKCNEPAEEFSEASMPV
jgi:ParB/RepB/Spo0J family partition protein